MLQLLLRLKRYDYNVIDIDILASITHMNQVAVFAGTLSHSAIELRTIKTRNSNITYITAMPRKH